MYNTFLKEALIPLIQKLDPEQKAAWGLMSPQHMVEHLSMIFAISNGKFQFPISADQAKLDRRKARFFAEDLPFPRDIKVSALPKDKTLPLRFANMTEAIAVLEKELNRFWTFFGENPEATNVHPVFGNLNETEWIEFHARHCRHHLMQFGLWSAA